MRAVRAVQPPSPAFTMSSALSPDARVRTSLVLLALSPGGSCQRWVTTRTGLRLPLSRSAEMESVTTIASTDRMYCVHRVTVTDPQVPSRRQVVSLPPVAQSLWASVCRTPRDFVRPAFETVTDEWALRDFTNQRSGLEFS